MTAPGWGLTSSLRVGRVIVCLGAALVLLADCVLSDDPLEPWTPDPEYLPGPTEVIARDGDRAVLPCGIKNLGTKQVSWKRLDQDHFITIGDMSWVRDDAVSLDYRSKELTDLTYWDLTFDPVAKHHAGVYECQVSAKQKHSRHITLRVIGPPVEKPAKPGLFLKGEKYVELGQKILLTCTANTGPHQHQDIDWFKDGDKLVSDSRRGVVITKYNSAMDRSLVSELMIDHSRVSDTGTYICRSASDEIESLKVTVLNADTNNVKREHDREGRKYYRSRYESASTSAHCSTSLFIVTVTLTLLLSWQRWS